MNKYMIEFNAPFVTYENFNKSFKVIWVSVSSSINWLSYSGPSCDWENKIMDFKDYMQNVKYSTGHL